MRRSGQGGSLSWLNGRELGMSSAVGSRDKLSRMLYSSMDVQGFWDPSSDGMHSSRASHGGIFNFDFSTDGSTLVAACERKSFLVFDPTNYKLVKKRHKAHTDCVNCVRFLDTRSFVTCSDDHSVLLWDLRFLKSSVRSFDGHTNWVKNIEYAPSLGLLVTSGFDGAVFTWDVNNYSNDEEPKRVFCLEGLMRCKLSPDESKMLISTSQGYILIVHDLDLSTLSVDLSAFASLHVSQVNSFNDLFERSQNRLEIINEFPSDNKASTIASIQVHPQSWCVASRNTSSDNRSEWTCVHDIHSQPLTKDECSEEEEEERQGCSARTHPPVGLQKESKYHQPQSQRPILAPLTAGGVWVSEEEEPLERVVYSSGRRPLGDMSSSTDDSFSDEDSESTAEIRTISSDVVVDSSGDEGGDNSSSSSGFRLSREDMLEDDDEDEDDSDADLLARRVAASRAAQDGGSRSAPPSDSPLSFFLWAQERRQSHYPGHVWWSALSRAWDDSHNIPSRDNVSTRLSREQRERAQRYIDSTAITRNQTVQRGNSSLARNFLLGLIGPLNHSMSHTYRSRPRLIYSKQEPNCAPGFIKEQCFSTDGRLIVSPCANGVRLLSFNEQCGELCDCAAYCSRKPRLLHSLRQISMHPQVVLTTKFSPTHSVFVTGSRDGSVSFLSPCP